MSRPRVAFFAGVDPFSLAVRAFTASRVTHAAVAIDGNILHAASKGVLLEDRRRLYTHYLYEDVAEFEVLPDVTPGLNYMLKQLGKPYDLTEIASRVISKIANAFSGIDRMDALNSPGQWTCARFVMALDPTRVVFPEWRALDPRTVTPASLLQATQISPYFRRVA